MNRLLMTMAVVVSAIWGTTDAFSFGQLFPASRRGVRGSLFSSLFPSLRPESNALEEAVKQASITHQTQAVKEAVNRKQTAVVKTHPVVGIVDHPMTKKPITTTTTTTTPAPQPIPLTNSPIYYIRLPPSPYVYMPGLGYVSPNTNVMDFLRPNIPFLGNGKPSNVYHFNAPAITTTTTTTTTTTPRPTTSTTSKPGGTKKPSPITWLPGSWIFNGRPSNLFIFRSPHLPSHSEKHRQTYSKPGTYLK